MAKKKTESKPKGRPKIIESPEKLWEYYKQYRKHIKNNPIKLEDYVGKDAIRVERTHDRPPTWEGFEVFLFEHTDISTGQGGYRQINLDKYKRNVGGSYGDFVGIVRAIKHSMFDDKFSGAAVGQWNQNIIAKEIGLTDAKEVSNILRPILENGKELPKD